METAAQDGKPHSLGSRNLIVVLALLFGVLIVYVAVGIFVRTVSGIPPSVWQNPPFYSGATELQLADFGRNGKPEISSNGYAGIVIMKVLTYTVQAPEADIISFYRQAFSSGGMHPVEYADYGRAYPPVKNLNYSWSSGGRSPTDYFLDLITYRADSEHTKVEIGISMSPGY